MRASGEAELIEWLLHQGRECDDLAAILSGVAARLVELGLPVVRLSLDMPTVDPISRMFRFVWWRDRGLSANRIGLERDVDASFRRSPLFYLRERRLPEARWNLEDPEVVSRYILFKELREVGVTEYALSLTSFSGRRTALQGVALSVATDQPGGFSDKEVATAIRIQPALALAAYRIGLLHVATETLGAYLGPNTGRRVLEGMVHRGDSRGMSAALLLADLRGFTALAERAEAETVVKWLNEHLEAIGEPVAEHGGEVLKFLGDGLLAVFASDGSDPGTSCARALAAAADALARNAALNASRAGRGEPKLDLHLVLHFGEVVYGNIGTARRLDFTVIGPAVNEASRMEALGKRLGRSLLLSATFAANCGQPCMSVGSHTLRGVTGEREIFVPARAELRSGRGAARAANS